MIKTIEISGRTREEAESLALAELGLDRDDVSVELITPSKPGFLGIGSRNAVIKVSYEVPDPKPEKEIKPEPKKEKSFVQKAQDAQKDAEKKADKPAFIKQEKNPQEKRPEQKSANKPAPKQENKAPQAPKAEIPKSEKPAVTDEPAEYAAIRSFLSGLLEKMGVKADIEISSRKDADGIDVKLSGNNMGAIIGRRGETLDAIQHLTNYAVNRGCDKRLHINVDAEGYRSKREESLVKLAEKMAEKAIKYKRSMALEPMNSYERHVIHSALQNYEGVTTASTGVEPNRRVVVSYVKPETSNKPQSREWA